MHSPAVREHALALVRSGLNDCEVARRTGIARTTIRDWRRPRYEPRGAERVPCPRCWGLSQRMSFGAADYAELLGLYLGDGHIVRLARTWRFRLFLDSKYEGIVEESRELLRRCFPGQSIGTVFGHERRMTILSVHSSHLPCVFPQHGPGMKHTRPIVFEDWQDAIVVSKPWDFLKGCIRSDGCSFINRTGPYEYLSYGFSNYSTDILDLFCQTCDGLGLEYRRYARSVRINRRSSVARLQDKIGVKR
ncbi:MAG TPA: helix-turn-helix domain-containing protein [Thermoleophilaceae bacterium]|nr:helix-turn-helix domain-containing protein [Thermoleophilaceae bacterium]